MGIRRTGRILSIIGGAILLSGVIIISILLLYLGQSISLVPSSIWTLIGAGILLDIVCALVLILGKNGTLIIVAGIIGLISSLLTVGGIIGAIGGILGIVGGALILGS